MITPKEMKKYRESYVLVAKQRALKKMQSTLVKKSYNLKEYTYTELRELYRLSHFTIRTSPLPLFLLQEAYKLDLINNEEKLVLFRDDKVLMKLDINTAKGVHFFLNTGIKEISNEQS